jgi:5-formyltetrahydrofolate cyclo-ligase
MSSPPAPHKAVLRKNLRALRRALPPEVHRAKSRRAAAALSRLPAFSAGRRVALYLPFDAEAATESLLAAARRRKLKVFVPVVADRRRRRLAFRELGAHTRRGAFGIHIPHGSRREVAARWFHLIIVPLVGVDADGRRLGMGGGFYDRTLRFRRQRTHWRGPRVIGLAFDCQCVASVGAESWDLAFDHVATESGIRHFRRGGA